MNDLASDTALPTSAITACAGHVADILATAVEHGPEAAALVVHDTRCALSRALTEAYRLALPEATFVDFDAVDHDAIKAGFDLLRPKDLVVLIQSTSFRLNEFRIRIELFRRGLAVIEHPHLERMAGGEALVYLDSLAYDADYYRGVGQALKQRIDRAAVGVLESAGARLTYPVGFEPAKLNVGDYAELPNVGGQFPIGEVFTESRDLEAVEGTVRIGFFGDTAFHVNRPPQPITLVIEGGRVVDVRDSTPEFDAVLTAIRAHEGEVWLRELGLGLNRAFSPERTVADIGTFERMCGVHLSLGAKHATYKKPQINKRKARFHVDVFAIVDALTLDGELIHRDGAWLV